MATDVLMLGGIVFDDWSTPEHMPFGGRQAMRVHQLPGGNRVIDTMGHDDDDIHWRGRFWGDNAIGQAMLLDAMRISGRALPLTYAGMAYLVVIGHFKAHIERFPQNVPYEINCVVQQNMQAAAVGFVTTGIGALIGADIGSALQV